LIIPRPRFVRLKQFAAVAAFGREPLSLRFSLTVGPRITLDGNSQVRFLSLMPPAAVENGAPARVGAGDAALHLCLAASHALSVMRSLVPLLVSWAVLRGYASAQPQDQLTEPGGQARIRAGAFLGSKAGDEREVAGIKVCWCPAGKFRMGSPRDEPERRPGEDQVEVTLTRGFWMGKFEVTQGQWKQVIGKLPGELTARLPAGDDYPVGNVNFAEAEAFCHKLTELGRQSGVLPWNWEFRLPTEAQWEYACRAGTTTASSFGNKLSSKQANFKGKPYNGGEPGPSLNRAAKVK
jgi:formylglycine-generating enzyme required for sulfatase activity